MSLFGSYCYYIFLFFTLKFQIGKKFVFEIWNILYGNYREKLLWFNAFFCQICENLYPQIIWFSNILLIQFSQNFLDCKKLFLRTFFFFMKHCLQNFPVFSFLGRFFGMILYIWPFANVYSCRKSLQDTISERHLPAFCKFFSFQKFVSRKLLPSWYWMLSFLFGYCFSLNNLLERFYF